MMRAGDGPGIGEMSQSDTRIRQHPFCPSSASSLQQTISRLNKT